MADEGEGEEEADEDGRGLSAAQKACVAELHAAGYRTLKPLLQEWLRRTKVDKEMPAVPAKEKVEAYERYQKLKGHKGNAIGAGVTPMRLRAYALEHTKEAEQARLGELFNDDTPYIINNPLTNFVFDAEVTKFAMFFTTNRLLHLAPNPGEPGSFSSCVLSLDDTHGCTYQGFPVMQPTIQDAARTSHPLGIVLASHQDAWAYQ